MPKEPTKLDPKSIVTKALNLIAGRHKVKDLIAVNISEDVVPSSGARLYSISAVSKADANGPQYTVTFDHFGDEADLPQLSEREGKRFFAAPALTVEPEALTPVAALAGVTVNPAENNLTLNQGDTFSETITVTVPKNTAVPKADVYFLADTTGSMGEILSAVQTGANNILTALNGLGIDFAYGVGNYKDFPNDPYAFQHQLSPTNAVASVAAAISAWSASGGNDDPEGQLYALEKLAVAPGGAPINWRSGAKRIIVWFGDQPGHDPVCKAISGEAADITEITATNRLVSERITVLAISTNNPGLDADPKSGTDYTSACGAPGGTAGQGTRIAAATGGAFVTGIDPTTIVNTIINLVTTAVSQINNVNLVPTGQTAPFVSSITPAGGYGPLAGDKDHTLKFDVVFKGVVPCKDELQEFKGTLDVVADGVVVASKRVVITVPPCKPKEVFSYSVKFVCGVQPECDCECASVRPGAYATEINIHNYQNQEAPLQKFVLPVVFAGAPSGREPKFIGRKAADRLVLPPHTATMDDCCRLAELLLGAAPATPLPLSVGFLEIVSPVELSVTAVYTASTVSGSLSIDVEQVEAKKVLVKPGA